MALIPELIINNIAKISANYTANVVEPSARLDHIREDLLASQRIRPFVTTSYPDISLAAVDGGRISQQLAGGDLIIIGATIGEGSKSRQMYFDEVSIPSHIYAEVLPHTSYNSEISESMMSLLELQVLGSVNTDVRIIDGAYLGNVSNLLFTFIKNNIDVSEAILSQISGDNKRYLLRAVNEIFNPTFDTLRLIAVPKSDSSQVFAKEFLGEDVHKITDRILSSRLLKSGEYLNPRPLQTNHKLISGIDKRKKGGEEWLSDPEFVKSFIEQGKAGLEDLGNHEEGTSLYTTYFKPTVWGDFAPAVKIEYAYNEAWGTLQEVTEGNINIINNDIVDESTLEPWAQIIADRRAKEVSTAANIVKNHLLAEAATLHEMNGLLRSYRT